MPGEKSIDVKIKELATELKVDLNEPDWSTMLENELKKTNRIHRFYKIFGMIILVFSAFMTIVSLIVDQGTFLGIEIKPHFYGAFMTVVMTSMIFITVGKLELKKDRMFTLMFLRGLKN